MLVIMKSAILIYNTQAGRGKIGRNVDHIVAIFRNAGYDMRPRLIAFGENPFDGYETVDLAVVAGGDGTLNYVVNAMKRKGLSLTLGVIPAGTANDFAGALGMSRNILKAAQQIAEGAVEQIDCGKVEQIGRGRDKHPDKDIYFVNIFSFGLFTTTSQHTSEHLKHRIGRLAYVVAAMRDLRNLHSIPLTITTDNETFYYQTLMGLVFNGETAGRVPLASKSSLRDGVFDCLFLRRRNLLLSVFDMVLYILGIKTPAIRFLRTSTLVLATCIDEDTDVDGQRGGKFPMRVVCLHGELNVVCPQDHDTD